MIDGDKKTERNDRKEREIDKKKEMTKIQKENRDGQNERKKDL